jgi:hypothetical protein
MGCMMLSLNVALIHIMQSIYVLPVHTRVVLGTTLKTADRCVLFFAYNCVKPVTVGRSILQRLLEVLK